MLTIYKAEFNDPSNGLYKYYYNTFSDPIRIESPKGKKEFTYNSKGQLINQVEIANDSSTAKNITFTYNTKGQLTKKEGTAKNAKNTSDTYIVTNTYATNGRLTVTKEVSNGREFEQNNIVYNDKGLITSYTKQVKSNNVITKADLENVYHPWSGIAYQLKDKNTGVILWQLDETKANGQVVKTSLGKTSIVNTYDDNNMLSGISHVNTNNATILKINYSFNAIKNELNSRKTLGDFSINETFTYDNNNRLTNWTNPTNGSMHFNVYDVKGRITENNQLGRINFTGSGKIYQPISVNLNQLGIDRYQNDLIQTISYNENNDPVFIDGTKGDASFSYGLTNMRQKVSYGGDFTQNTDGKFTKIYDESGSVEIIINNQTGAEKHILYIGGTPYDANVILVKDYNTSTANYHFLHKDYIGSILAITDQNGTKVEQRHFDAWGNITHLKQGNNVTITDVNVIAQTALFLDRGYTSHEHFQELGIIHMNGRLYDPILRRFLNADENIQDPMNTQNYNKYGYVLNNPLMFNDPSGEFFVAGFFLAYVAPVIWGAIIGAGIGVVTYSLSVAISGQKWNIGGALKGMMWGAISAAVTAGIGSAFSAIPSSSFTTLIGIAKAGSHAVSQGVLSLVQGGNFYQAFISGAAGSLAAYGWGHAAGKFADSTVGMISFAAVSGGVGSYLVGGNFWEGFIIGGVVAGLNDALHEKNINSEDNDHFDREGNFLYSDNEGDDIIIHMFPNYPGVKLSDYLFSNLESSTAITNIAKYYSPMVGINPSELYCGDYSVSYNVGNNLVYNDADRFPGATISSNTRLKKINFQLYDKKLPSSLSNKYVFVNEIYHEYLHIKFPNLSEKQIYFKQSQHKYFKLTPKNHQDYINSRSK